MVAHIKKDVLIRHFVNYLVPLIKMGLIQICFGLAINLSPVSYTHLDVYKRQLLEESLGIQLFIRTHRGLSLTEAGKSFYQDAKYIIQYCKDSIVRAKNAMQKDSNIIRIGTSPMTPDVYKRQLLVLPLMFTKIKAIWT